MVVFKNHPVVAVEFYGSDHELNHVIERSSMTVNFLRSEIGLPKIDTHLLDRSFCEVCGIVPEIKDYEYTILGDPRKRRQKI